MNLPNYFLADLPPEATLSPSMITEACLTLKRNRERYLAQRSTQSMVALLSSVAKSWLETENPFRKRALEQGPAATNLSRETLANGLDAFFRALTAEKFQALLVQDLGHAQRLDRLTASEADQRARRASLATAPELLTHIAPANLPVSLWMSLVLGVLVRSAQFVKCATGAALLPRLFAHSVYEADAKVGSCLEIAEWPGGNLQLEEALFAETTCVTATGTDETLEALRQRLPRRVRFVPYGNRVSFGFVSHEVLSWMNAASLAGRAAADVVAWNQLGCLSPHVFYVQRGGEIPPARFAELLAEELAQREQLEPRGPVPDATAAAIASRRSIYELRAAHSPDTKLWCSQGSTAWTVVYETENDEASSRFQLSCLHRFIYVKSVKDLAQALQITEPMRGQLSTVGLAAPEHRAEELATELARWGVTRVCPLGQMQNPPLTWRHDGRPALGELVTWTDWEAG